MSAANRTQLIAIVLIAALSLGGSYALFYYTRSSGEFATTNHGEFVVPPSTVAQLGWEVEGRNSTGRRWWVWTVASTCDEVCRASIKNMRAVHILLNKEAGRVRRGITTTMQEPLPAWTAAYPKLTQVSVAQPERVAEGIYIVDPNGNLVFFYPLGTDPKSVLEDLKKLLEVSQIG